jgi:hypothetical protein
MSKDTITERPTPTPGRNLAHAAFLFLAIALIWDFRAGLPLPESGIGVPNLNSDLLRYYYPIARYQGEMLASGELPFWNPWQLAGFPLLAAPAAGILYPPLLILTTLLPPELALEAHAILHLFIGAWFVMLLLVRLQVSPLAATVGALAFAISDQMLLETEITSYLSTVAWIPGIFWAIVALVDEPRFRRALALAAILALSFLGGHAQGLLYAIYWAIPFGVATIIWRAPDLSVRIRVFLWLVPAAILTFLFVAPQLFPSLELMFGGSRSQQPLTVGQASFGAYRWQVIWKTITAFSEPGVLFGYPTLLLALLGALGSSQRWARLTLASLAVLACLYLQGTHTAVWGVFYELPLGKSFRGPQRISPIFVFFASALVGFGAQSLMTLARNQRRISFPPIVVAGTLLLLLAGDALRFGPVLSQYQQLRQMEFWGVPDLPQVPPEELDFQRALLLDGMNFRDLSRQIKSGMVLRRMIVGDYEPILPRPYLDLLDESALWHGRMDLNSGKFPKLTLLEYSRTLNLMGVREILSFGKLSAYAAWREANTKQIEKTGAVWIQQREIALPRTFVVYETHVEPRAKQARTRLLSATFEPLNEAIVASGTAMHPPESLPPGFAQIKSYEADRVEIDAFCHGPCLLVLTDLFYPGWEAWAGDQEIPILKTDVAFRGVALPAGQHRVEFRYRPFSFRVGAWLFLLGLAATIVGLFRDRRPPA